MLATPTQPPRPSPGIPPRPPSTGRRRAAGVAGLRFARRYYDHLEGGAAPGARVSSRFYHDDAVFTLHLSADGDALIRDPMMRDDIMLCPTVEGAEAVAARLDALFWGRLVSVESVDCQACGGAEGGDILVVASGFTCSAAAGQEGAGDEGWVDETAVSFTQTLLLTNRDGGPYRITNDVFRQASGSGAGSRTASPALAPSGPGFFPRTAAASPGGYESEAPPRRLSPNKMPARSASLRGGSPEMQQGEDSWGGAGRLSPESPIPTPRFGSPGSPSYELEYEPSSSSVSPPLGRAPQIELPPSPRTPYTPAGEMETPATPYPETPNVSNIAYMTMSAASDYLEHHVWNFAVALHVVMTLVLFAAVTFLLHSNMTELKSLDKSLQGVEGRFMGSHVFAGETISMRRAFRMDSDEFNIKTAMPTEM